MMNVFTSLIFIVDLTVRLTLYNNIFVKKNTFTFLERKIQLHPDRVTLDFSTASRISLAVMYVTN